MDFTKKELKIIDRAVAIEVIALDSSIKAWKRSGIKPASEEMIEEAMLIRELSERIRKAKEQAK